MFQRKKTVVLILCLLFCAIVTLPLDSRNFNVVKEVSRLKRDTSKEDLLDRSEMPQSVGCGSGQYRVDGKCVTIPSTNKGMQKQKNKGRKHERNFSA